MTSNSLTYSITSQAQIRENQQQSGISLQSLTGSKHSRDSEDEEESERPKKKKHISSYSWIITWNHGNAEDAARLLAMKQLRKWAIQEEISSTKTEHLQGLLTFSHKKSWAFVTKSFPMVHWEAARSVAACAKYCQKQRTRREGGKQWIKGYTLTNGQLSQPAVVRDPLDGKTLYKYQAWIKQKIQEDPDDRRIMWFYSTKGNVGKSSLTKHLVMKHNAILIGGTFKDAYYAIAKMRIKPTLVIFDIPRNQGRKVSYTAMEGIKNGCFFAQKYESLMVLMNNPHIVIFANEAPQTEAMSDDRWEIYCLDNQDDLAHIPEQQHVEIHYAYDFSL